MKRWLSGLALVLVACGGTGPTGVDDTTGVIRIRNESSIAIVEVNISRCEVAVWGANRIDDPIDPDESRDFPLTPNCYDLRVLGSSSEEVTFFDLTVTNGVILPITIVDQ